MFSSIRPEGNALLVAVTTLTCLGFLLIGFDNGLMGGFVNSPAFTETARPGVYVVALVLLTYLRTLVEDRPRSPPPRRILAHLGISSCRLLRLRPSFVGHSG